MQLFHISQNSEHDASVSEMGRGGFHCQWLLLSCSTDDHSLIACLCIHYNYQQRAAWISQSHLSHKGTLANVVRFSIIIYSSLEHNNSLSSQTQSRAEKYDSK